MTWIHGSFILAQGHKNDFREVRVLPFTGRQIIQKREGNIWMWYKVSKVTSFNICQRHFEQIRVSELKSLEIFKEKRLIITWSNQAQD